MKVIGVMSGTSVDGIDIALCDINGVPPALDARILAAGTVEYNPVLRERILAACEGGTVAEICRLNANIGAVIADAIYTVVPDLTGVDLIASHGQTVWHDITSTLQIGEGAEIAERTRVTTLNNFRPRDISAGGHGAPLTAYVDWLLLRHPNHWRAVQNIGGMGNVSLLPPLNAPTADLIAFDTGPGNALMDLAAMHFSAGAQTYDPNGAWAAAGNINGALLETLMSHPYFAQAPPRTTGREMFGPTMAQNVIAAGLSREDTLATLTAFTAYSIADAYQRFAPTLPHEVIIGGGGSHNPTLLTMLGELLPKARLLRHEDIGLSSDFKEALVFAVLGYETWHNRPASLPSQTGARHSSVLGQIIPGANYETLIKETWL
ncbi:MAG: anhydro-N-acetylmuramic acid kinase [Anaerolineales bacterium]